MQSAVLDRMVKVTEGMLGCHPQRVVSGIADGVVYNAKALSFDPSDADNVANRANKVHGYVTGEVFAGVTFLDEAKEPLDSGYNGYADLDAVPLVTQGQVWVKTADPVTDLSNGVWVRGAVAGTPPDDALGSFRATTATNFVDLTTLAEVKWLASITIGSDYYGLLSVHIGD